MAVHNAERFLSEAVDSVLAQTFSGFELLLIDDASTDRSGAIAASYRDPRVRVVSNEVNLGLTRSLNLGLSLITTEYVVRLDADDLALPDRLARQIAWLDQHPDVAVVGSQAIAIDAQGHRIRRISFHPQWRRPAGGVALDWYRTFDTPFVHSAVMFRREAIAALGGYDEAHSLEQDAELWMRAGRRYRLANLEEPLVAVRAHASSMTADPKRSEREGYAQRKASIIHALLKELLRDEAIPRSWAESWVAGNDPWTAMPPAQIRELTAILADCAERFFALHPEARSDRDIAAHRVSALARLVDKADRRTMLRLVAQMFAIDGRTAASVLPRIVPFLILGDAALPLWRRSA